MFCRELLITGWYLEDYGDPVCTRAARPARCTVQNRDSSGRGRSYLEKMIVRAVAERLRIATGAPWYISDRQIHEDLGVPFFTDHITALTENFESKVG